MKRIKSRTVEKLYYCYCCKNFVDKPTYDSEGAKCSKCGWSVVKIKKPKSENEAWAALFQLAILSQLDVVELRNVERNRSECVCCNNLDAQFKEEMYYEKS